MSNKLIITSLPEWLAPPKIEPFQIGSPAEKGSVYEVHKAGFLIADKAKCDKHALKIDVAFESKFALPTSVVIFNGEKQLVSLPLELSVVVQ